MKYYEIVRLANQWPETDYEEVENMIRRGWLKKALEYMSNWDYGGENIGAALALGQMRDTILDDKSTGDKIIYEKDGYYLCEAHCPSGLYDAYYLVRGIENSELDI